MTIAIVLLVAILSPSAASGQESGELWGEPVNLSRTGSASAPQIVAGREGSLQAFWWDAFDGMTTAIYNGDSWTGPVAAPILVEEPDDEDEVELVPLELMPRLIADGTDRIHAFWIGEPDEDTGATPLMLSQTVVSGTLWSPPVELTESTASFEAARTPDGGLILAYVRTAHSDQFPAGLYVKSLPGGDGDWSEPGAAHQSIYYRNMTSGAAHIRIAAGAGGTVHLAWYDSYLARSLYSYSTDGGIIWSRPEVLGAREDEASMPRVFALSDGGALRSWEATEPALCTIYQQRNNPGDRADRSWSSAQRVLPGLPACPSGGEDSWSKGDLLAWVWGQGGSSLGFAAWDVVARRWSEPRSLEFSFEDELTGHRLSLDGLHIVQSGEELVVVGVARGDVWSVREQLSLSGLAFAPPSPWEDPVQMSADGTAAGWPAVAVDDAGTIHLLWASSASPNLPGTSLVYASWATPTGRSSTPIAISEAIPGEGVARQPGLVVDSRGILHAVWSGDVGGEILYSRAKVEQATGAAGWSAAKTLPMPSTLGSWPQVAVGPDGELVVAYAVPINEDRGIYVVRSADSGETWSDSETVFDAAGARHVMVDQPALSIAADGSVHVAWVELSSPDMAPTRAIYYAVASGGDDWSDAVGLAGPGANWPRLAATGSTVHLVYRDGNGTAWHRPTPTDRSAELQLAGLEGGQGPLGAAAGSGEALQLSGGADNPDDVRHSTYGDGAWTARPSLVLGPSVQSVLGAVSSSRPGIGLLAVVARVTVAGDGGPTPAVVVSWRRVDGHADVRTEALPAAEEAEDEPKSEAGPESTPLAAENQGEPSPTPDLSPVPQGPSWSSFPLIAGGGIAAIAVVGLLLVSVAAGRRRR